MDNDVRFWGNHATAQFVGKIPVRPTTKLEEEQWRKKGANTRLYNITLLQNNVCMILGAGIIIWTPQERS